MRLSCKIDRAELLRCLGYSGQYIDENLQHRLSEATAACEQSTVPMGVFASFPIERAGASIALSGTTFVLHGIDIARHLEGAQECVLMAVTLGAVADREIARRSALGATDALLYDAACSALVEAAADTLQNHVAIKAAQRGLSVGQRYSPGYGDFSLAGQRSLLAVLDASRRIGLVVTEDNLLVPTKSITAVAGLFEDGCMSEEQGSVERCKTCGMRDRCLYRREGGTCHG